MSLHHLDTCDLAGLDTFSHLLQGRFAWRKRIVFITSISLSIAVSIQLTAVGCSGTIVTCISNMVAILIGIVRSGELNAEIDAVHVSIPIAIQSVLALRTGVTLVHEPITVRITTLPGLKDQGASIFAVRLTVPIVIVVARIAVAIMVMVGLVWIGCPEAIVAGVGCTISIEIFIFLTGRRHTRLILWLNANGLFRFLVLTPKGRRPSQEENQSKRRMDPHRLYSSFEGSY
jgi:hypothetical protein